MAARPCRVLIERSPRSGALNMAIDELLLDAAAERGECALRCYRWSEATVSLGYFQKPEEAKEDPRLARLPVVRRLSGGGAILHHHEWTYSCTLPAGDALAVVPLHLYDRLHAAIVEWLRDLEISAELRGEALSSALRPDSREPAARGPEAFLCFSRGDPRDIVLSGHKILGSAQRRRRGAVLQHGSLLLRASRFAPQFPGLLDLSGRDDLERRLPEALADKLVAALGRRADLADLTPAEESEAARRARSGDGPDPAA